MITLDHLLLKLLLHAMAKILLCDMSIKAWQNKNYAQVPLLRI